MPETIAHDFEAKSRTKDVILDQSIDFASLLLPEQITKGLASAGFKKPSPIQFKALPLGRCGFDLIVKSKSGTGKTLVFGVIALETVNTERKCCQALILVPAREIAVQIYDVLKSMGRYIEGLIVEYFIGGLPVEDDIKKAKLCHIAVGAPGRVKHLISMGALSSDFVRLFVLDEADKLMDTTFQSDINDIFNSLPARKQLIATSATYPQELDTFLANYMVSPTYVSSENETPLLLGLKQYYAAINEPSFNSVQEMRAKNNILLDVLSKVSFTQCLVFCNYQTRAQSISNFFNQKGWNCSYVSAAESQTKRLEAVKNLKDFKSRILFSTDLTSRGIDAANVDLVVNYDLPFNAVEYLHRMGRAGRFGSKGICINLIDEKKDLKKLQYILGSIGGTNLSISELPVLNGENLDCENGQMTKVWGVVPTEEDIRVVKDDIVRGVMDLKQAKKPNKNVKKEQKKKKIDTQHVQSVLSEKEQEIDEVCENLNGTDVDRLFKTCLETDEDNKKRKRIDLEDNKEYKEKRKNINKQIIFTKNRALLTITRLLNDVTFFVDLDVVNSLEEYLVILKEEHLEQFEENSIEEILCPTKTCEGRLKVSIDPESSVLEDIFKIGFESVLKGNNWIDHLSSKEIRDVFSSGGDQQIITSDDDVNEDYDEEVETAEEEMVEKEKEEDAENSIEKESGNMNQDISLQWIPVVRNENTNSGLNDHYTECFNGCNNMLWEWGLRFETVEEFDDWFHSWQEELQSVRNYVQQNIYVAEMGRYQQSKMNDKK